MANDKNLYTLLEASFRAAGDSPAFVAPSGRTVTYKALTDDVGRMANALVGLRIKHIRTKPYTPQTNGKAERFIQTALREWAYATAFEHSDQRRDALVPWLHRYNWHRPHASLATHQPPRIDREQPLEDSQFFSISRLTSDRVRHTKTPQYNGD